MSLPALLLSINGLSIGMVEERPVSKSEDDDVESDSLCKRKKDCRTSERSRNRQRTSDGVYSYWVPNAMDSSSEYIRRKGNTKHDKWKKHTEDFIEVEVACSLFVRLSSAASKFKNESGEPDDWNFDNPNEHQYLTSENPQMDQPWLDAKLDHHTNEWEVVNHEGRHRSAWVCNHMNDKYTYLTVLIGLNWEDEKIIGADVGDIFNGSGARAELVRNPRPEGVEFMLIQEEQSCGSPVLCM